MLEELSISQLFMIRNNRHKSQRSHSTQGLTAQNQYGGEEVDSRPKKTHMAAFTMGTSMLRPTALSCYRSFPKNRFGRIKIPTLSRWGERLVTLIVVAIVFAWLLRHNREESNEGWYMAETKEVGGDISDASPKVAVCFFGLTRSLRWTLPSVQQRVFDVLRREGMHVDVFLHTYHVMEVNNERAGEKDIDYSPYLTDFHELHPVRSLVTNQDDFDLAWPEPISLTRYNWNYPEHLAAGVIRNVFRAYWSIAMVWSLVAEYAATEGLQYDAVVLARPDVWFHVDIDLPRRTFPLPERTVFLPSFETDLTTGGRKNDRFAYGSFDTMRVMMNRIATLLDANAGRFRGEIDSEWVMGRHIDSNGISVQTMEFSVTRVRLTGDIPFFDHGRVREACESGVDPMACKMVDLDYRFPFYDNGVDLDLVNGTKIRRSR